MGGGTFDTERIVALSHAFLGSELVVRLAEPVAEGERPPPPRWSTVAHLAAERDVLDRLQELAARSGQAVEDLVIDAAVAAEGRLGDDQAAAVRVLCGPGRSLRLVAAPAGYGKTTTVHAASVAQVVSHRRVLGLATTHQATAELRQATPARLSGGYRAPRACEFCRAPLPRRRVSRDPPCARAGRPSPRAASRACRSPLPRPTRRRLRRTSFSRSGPHLSAYSRRRRLRSLQHGRVQPQHVLGAHRAS